MCLSAQSGETVALADGLFGVDLGAIIHVLNDYRSLRILAHGFLMRPFAGAAG